MCRFFALINNCLKFDLNSMLRLKVMLPFLFLDNGHGLGSYLLVIFLNYHDNSVIGLNFKIHINNLKIFGRLLENI